MGAWGVGPFENDDGSDIKDIWEEYIDSEWDSVKVFHFFRKVYFNGVLPNVTDGNSNKYIAIASKYDDKKLELPSPLIEKLGLAISRELEQDVMQEWGKNKTKRKNILTKLAEKHSIELQEYKGRSEASSYTEEIVSLENWFDNIEKVNSLLEKQSLKVIEWMESIKPEFIQTLEDNTWRFQDESDEDSAAKLSELRYLAVIWFVLFNLKYKPEEISNVLKAEREIS